MLDKLDDVVALLETFKDESTTADHTGMVSPDVSDMHFCPRCSEITRMKITLYDSGNLAFQLYAQKFAPEYLVPGDFRPVGLGHPSKDSEPTLLTYRCNLCKTRFAAVIHWGANGPALVVFSECGPSFSSTGNVPLEVTFHLDEAYAAHCIGANTAAVASFRAALENLLHCEGYTTGMLDAKVTAVETDKAAGKGPGWVSQLDPEFLKVIKRLGNKSVHIKNISRLAAFDTALSLRLVITFKYLINAIYEQSGQQADLLAELQRLNKRTK